MSTWDANEMFEFLRQTIISEATVIIKEFIVFLYRATLSKGWKLSLACSLPKHSLKSFE